MKHSFVCEQHFLSKKKKRKIYRKPNICNRLPSQKKQTKKRQYLTDTLNLEKSKTQPRKTERRKGKLDICS